MSLRYTPVGDRIVVLQHDPETVLASGLVIPSNATEKPTTGEVVAVGETDVVQVGDVVMYSKYGGIEVEVDRTTYLVLRETDVLMRQSAAEAAEAE